MSIRLRLWLLAKRQALQQSAAVGLRDGDASADPASARDRSSLAQSCRSILLTRGCRALIRASARPRDFGGACACTNRYGICLDQEFDVEPSAETQA